MDLEHIPGLGTKRIQILRQAGLGDIPSLLRYIPRDWLDRTQVTPIAQLVPDRSQVMVGRIVRCGMVYGRRKRLLATLQDSSGQISLVFFRALQHWQKKLQIGSRWIAVGKPASFRGLQLVHPELETLNEEEDFQGSLVPVYPIREEMRQSRMEQTFFRKLMTQLFNTEWIRLKKTVPESIQQRYHFIPELDNLRRLHFPGNQHDIQQGKRQIKIQELLPWCLRMVQRRHHLREQGISKTFDFALKDQLAQQLPFSLTEDQNQAIQTILNGLASSSQFHALLQGDVGSGKTIVALFAMIACAQAGFQSALMVPTDILARQHLESLKPWFDAFHLRVALLVGATRSSERKEILYALETGEVHAIIGTHALYSKDVIYHQLGLVIIDEQHRFGVQQRETLLHKGLRPDLLVMSATPIPRSLAMTFYGDLQPVIIRQKPPGRLPVKTRLVEESKRMDMLQFIERECLQGNQCYWIVSRVDSSENPEDPSPAVDSLLQELQQISKRWKVGAVHGRQDERERNQILQNFAQGNLHVLVSTTVVEVGVNVPNANLMVIESPERFGLAQLHQLRGRVGRSSTQAWCFLMPSHKPSSEESDGIAIKEQLQGFAHTNDGFEIAEMDLKYRGAGNLEGSDQSGNWILRWFDWMADQSLIQQIIQDAEDILSSTDSLSDSEKRDLEEWYQEHRRQHSDSPSNGIH